MPTEIRIPKLGVSMTEGILSEWLVADGATVAAGTPIYLLEMDKSTSEIETPVTGQLRILGTPGETYQIGDLVATIE
jgi:pyruvate/2-oxoglutarate dehydrogenase complex dihydrolipoamide acyltransferase (E2) component